jgi:hypothetical protein
LRELTQPWQGGILSGTKIGEDLADDTVQLVRCFGLADAGPASHPFGNIRLLHPFLM